MKGPVELLVIAFPGNKFKGEIIPELEKVVNDDLVKIIDLVFITKDTDGNVAIIEASDSDDELNQAVARYATGVEGLLSHDDISEVAEVLENNSSAGILVFEHLWARGFKQAVLNAGGKLILDERIPAEIVDEAVKAVSNEG